MPVYPGALNVQKTHQHRSGRPASGMNLRLGAYAPVTALGADQDPKVGGIEVRGLKNHARRTGTPLDSRTRIDVTPTEAARARLETGRSHAQRDADNRIPQAR